MAIDPAVMAIYQMIIGMVVMGSVIALSIWLIDHSRKQHPFYHLGEAMAVAWSKGATEKLRGEELSALPTDPAGLEKLTEDQKERLLKERTERLARERKALESAAKDAVTE